MHAAAARARFYKVRYRVYGYWHTHHEAWRWGVEPTSYVRPAHRA